MGHAPLFSTAVHKTADVSEAFPEAAHVQFHRPGAVRLPQLAYPLSHEHERYPPADVSLHVVQAAAHAVQEGGKVEIVGHDGGGSAGEVFLRH